MSRALAPALLLAPALPLAALLTLSACTTNDWGRCLASHQESRQTEPIQQPDGTVVPSGEYETVTICDRWEYPGGVRP